jgi:hypothetical protein
MKYHGQPTPRHLGIDTGGDIAGSPIAIAANRHYYYFSA